MTNYNTRDFALVGFRMPAEWEEHDACWMMWPSREEVWLDMEKTKQDYARVANAISQYEPVNLLINSEDIAQARPLLEENVFLIEAALNDSWARDACPNFLINSQGKLAGSSWRFNAWGEKYQPYQLDNELGQTVLTMSQAQCVLSDLVAEGGAITTDGEGTLITTESCLLNPNRNPGWTKQEVEWELCRTLGAEKVIWLPGNSDEKETDGHVDGIAQFIRPGLVLMEASFNTSHPWYHIMKDNIAALEGQIDAKGRKIQICFIEDGFDAIPLNDQFCTSYINSYFANGAVIMPKYGIAADERAKQVYRRLFPDRDIVQLNIAHIAVGGGGIHCITQQQPKVSR